MNQNATEFERWTQPGNPMECDAVMREVVGTTLDYLAIEIERSIAGQIPIKTVLELIHGMSADLRTAPATRDCIQ